MKAIPTALTQSLKDWEWRPLACEASLSRNHKIAGKNFLRRKFLKAIPTTLTQSLKAWDWRPLAYERSLFRNYKNRVQKFSAPKSFESESLAPYRPLPGPLPAPYQSLTGPLLAPYRPLNGPLPAPYWPLTGPSKQPIIEPQKLGFQYVIVSF